MSFFFNYRKYYKDEPNFYAQSVAYSGKWGGT